MPLIVPSTGGFSIGSNVAPVPTNTMNMSLGTLSKQLGWDHFYYFDF